MGKTKKMAKIAINGLGRIGRAFLKLALARPEIEVVAVNDIGDIDNIAYLLRHDSVYGKSEFKIEAKNQSSGSGDKPFLSINGHKLIFLSERDPAKLPWRELGIDIAVESTGIFESYEKSRAHIDAGARRVIITAPSKDENGGKTILMGVNDSELGTCEISSNGSCTTNAGSPVLAILHKALGVDKAILNTIHAYTATQKIVDGPDARDFRRGRAGAVNLVPSTTGAAVSVTKAITELDGKFDGIAVRAPVVAGAIADITFISSRETTAEEVNEILERAATDEKWKGIFTVTKEPLVSSDIVGDTHASIADLSLTKVVGNNLVKVMAWYDNEIGYANTLVEHVVRAGEYL